MILNQSDAATALDCDPSTIRRYLDRGILETVWIGKVRKTTSESVDKYQATRMPWSLTARAEKMKT